MTHYVTVPHTCPYIDDAISMLEEAYALLEEKDTEYRGPVSIARARISSSLVAMEDIRTMNAELREEGEVAGDAADNFERQVQEWQEIAVHAEEKIEMLEKKLFDIENEREEERWQEYSLTQLSLQTGSS